MPTVATFSANVWNVLWQLPLPKRWTNKFCKNSSLFSGRVFFVAKDFCYRITKIATKAVCCEAKTPLRKQNLQRHVSFCANVVKTARG